ncbi:hypothetical protein NECAME_02195 [Necator americanus]|uniref:Uncharacterized protein n=1 Tax=Necator americanus TaxID=51031 RepID=W2TH41_NECAM|nr:hypothetical protein NECAME_02195 [Necator americanus]ETN81153.1 hypothetical protein NECAME_02195 [Necator americanus]
MYKEVSEWIHTEYSKRSAPHEAPKRIPSLKKTPHGSLISQQSSNTKRQLIAMYNELLGWIHRGFLGTIQSTIPTAPCKIPIQGYAEFPAQKEPPRRIASLTTSTRLTPRVRGPLLSLAMISLTFTVSVTTGVMAAVRVAGYVEQRCIIDEPDT